jgi:hypothetical protein
MRSRTPRSNNQSTDLKDSNANVLVTVATAKFAAQAIKKVGEIGRKPADHFEMVRLPGAFWEWAWRRATGRT